VKLKENGVDLPLNSVTPAVLLPFVQSMADNHPSLSFLKSTTEFHEFYVHVCVMRLFYVASSRGAAGNGSIVYKEFKACSMASRLKHVEDEEDINMFTDSFSYCHFHVIYCKFWELDEDRDMLLCRRDLLRYGGGTLSPLIVERIFGVNYACADLPISAESQRKIDISPKNTLMTFQQFVWFILSEEDKTTDRSINFWFHCLDLDQDGVLSCFELEKFYVEQQRRMEAKTGQRSFGCNQSSLTSLALRELLDMLEPAYPDRLYLKDLRRSPTTSADVFNLLFSLNKFLFEERVTLLVNNPDLVQRLRRHKGGANSLSVQRPTRAEVNLRSSVALQSTKRYCYSLLTMPMWCDFATMEYERAVEAQQEDDEHQWCAIGSSSFSCGGISLE